MFLIVNAGSTSIKTRLLDRDLQTLAFLDAEYHADSGLTANFRDLRGHEATERMPELCRTQEILTWIYECWQKMLAGADRRLSACGHRIVHGGSEYAAITRVDRPMLDRIGSLDAYAPVHNPLNRLGVELAFSFFPDVPQYAVFDTAFHRGMPEHVRRYAIPGQLAAGLEFYRYGFHGISCQHSLTAAAKLLDLEAESLNLIVLHLGGGASATAIRFGKSVDTSMGFSPTDGLIMAERCGDLDPMIPVTLMKQGWSPERLDRCFNHDSGLRALCGSSDMRAILAGAQQGDKASDLALNAYCYRIKKYVGAYAAILGEVSAVVFTGGIGEHAAMVRERIMAGLDRFGMVLDAATNLQNVNIDRNVGATDSPTAILVVHAEEEREIARQILATGWS